ncbi:redox-regulated ATPase YchF [Candidatus Babeliales bacterium]|nr:redox-regulated ATPase YchF [Candidatus Babeliales bacterium]MBP9843907.1 redox-regulated ATPase YchF [Candidatus Babeliales bacterium]
MNIKVGLVGLPNVGKSTLFNALTKSSVPAENYPFCTIDPHVAITHVPDIRMNNLQESYGSKKLIPSMISFVDIAGLVKGAATGQGLGNQFLSNIREVNLILHVLRCFDDSNILRDQEKIDPVGDFEIIVNELMLKDLESIEKRMIKLDSQLKGKSIVGIERKQLEDEKALLIKILEAINAVDVKKVRSIFLEANVETISLLATKNFLIVANISENDIDNPYNNKYVKTLQDTFGADIIIPACIRTEYELSQLDEQESKEMMEMLNLQETALTTLIQKSFTNLGLITFFTCGPQEIHAWPIEKGMTIRQASGEIHSDLQRGFICAEVFSYVDLMQQGSIVKLKDAGKFRTEGQDYLMQDGDIINVKFNV